MKSTAKNRALTAANLKFAKKPIKNHQIHNLYNVPLNVLGFQRIARNHYHTDRFGDLLYLRCPTTNKNCTINFSQDEYGYVRVKFSNEPYSIDLKVSTNKDLFIGLRRNRVI